MTIDRTPGRRGRPALRAGVVLAVFALGTAGGCASTPAGGDPAFSGSGEPERTDRVLASVVLLHGAGRLDAARAIVGPADDEGGASLRSALAPMDRLWDTPELRLDPLVDGRVVGSVGLIGRCESRAELLALAVLARAHHDLGHVRAAMTRALGEAGVAVAREAAARLIGDGADPDPSPDSDAEANPDESGAPSADGGGNSAGEDRWNRLHPEELGALVRWARAARGIRFTAGEEIAARARAREALDRMGTPPGSLERAFAALARAAEAAPELARPLVERHLIGALESDADPATPSAPVVGEGLALFQETVEPIRARSRSLPQLAGLEQRVAQGAAGLGRIEVEELRAGLGRDARFALAEAAILAVHGDRALALLALRRAVALDGSFAEARRALGAELLARNDAESALRELDRAIALAPLDARSRLLRARALGELGRGAGEIRRAAAVAAATALPGGAIAAEARAILDRLGPGEGEREGD